MRGLYVGRFQPFHQGHLSVVKRMQQEVNEIIIGIGSAEDNYQPANPFTGRERFEMIENSLLENNIPREKLYIIPIRNINNYALWVSHLELLLPKFDIVYTGSPVVKSLFLASGKYQVADIEKELKICATDIRQKIINKDESWKKDVPQAVKNKIVEINGEHRVRNLGTY